tara:strand:- start:1360 stop:1542 length:183 start_codon:yes stop_codon:yes gene_type:complete
MSITYEKDFDDFCRVQYEQINLVLFFLGLENDETYSDFKDRNFLMLEVEYLHSIGKLSIH